MSKTILVTGGTGTLGRVVVGKLRDAGVPTRVFSRHPGAGTAVGNIAVGNLVTGEGLTAALADVGTIIHCATGSKDTVQTTNLIAAAKQAGGPHLVYISIVGVDRHPFAYYRSKLAAEKLVEASGLPFTILRATQFHNLVARLLDAQHVSPVILVPDIPLQPIDVHEVAERLVGLSTAPAFGHVDDFGGPAVRPFRELATSWLRASGYRRALVPVTLPGKTFRAFTSGVQLTPDHANGTTTFEDFLAVCARPGHGR